MNFISIHKSINQFSFSLVSLLGQFFVNPIKFFFFHHIRWIYKHFLSFCRHSLSHQLLVLIFNIFPDHQTNSILWTAYHLNKWMRHNFLDDPEPILHTQRYQVSFLTSNRQYVLCISLQNSLLRIKIFVLFFIWIKRILFNQKRRYQSNILLPFQQLFQNNISQIFCLRVLSYQRAFVEQGSATNTVHHI